MNRVDERLQEDFDDKLIPDISTISRIIKRMPLDELKEDVPFSWGAMEEIPWEDSRLVLGMWADYQSQQMDRLYGPFTRRLAKWCWRVLKAFGVSYSGYRVGLDVFSNDSDENRPVDKPSVSAFIEPFGDDVIDDIWFVSLEFSWREIASTVMDEPFDTRDLDLWLAFAPWKGREWMDRYLTVKYDETFDESSQRVPIHWHLLDMEWLDRVVPIVAENRRAFSPDSIKREPLPLRSDIDHMFYEHWQKLIDGLLGSQINLYRKHLGQDPDIARLFNDGMPRPWYFDYLDEVIRDPATYGKDNAGDEG
ncbi:MAG: hypothetical protein IH870_02335 [Chloroflexi bacterium]|nr:hypothetical protein [Chloroflexota bacterium]